MRARTMSLICSLMVTATVSAVHAEDRAAVFTRRGTNLRARPGETAPVVARADSGEELTVVGSRGRWLRVRRGKRVGWVTRSQVEDRGATAPRQRAQRTGFSGRPLEDALRVAVTIDRVRGFDDPTTKANLVLDLERGDTVTVLGRGHDGWLLVEASAGGVGWIPATAVTDGGRFAGDPRRAPGAPPATARDLTVVVTDDDTVAPTNAGPAPRAATSRRRVVGTLVATAGAQTFAMRQVGAGGEALATARGAAAAFAASAGVRLASNLWVGASADGELGTGALVYTTPGEASPPMTTRATSLDGRAQLGWGRRWQVVARGGYHFGALTIASDRAEPMLVGEQVAGLTVGLGGAVPLGRRAALTTAIDVMPAGAQRPSELLPGILYANGMRAAWLHTTVSLRLPARMVAAVSYRGTLATVDLTDGAAAPTTATRTDQAHSVTAGLGLAW